MNRMASLSITALLATAAMAVANAQPSERMTVYRCSNEAGGVSLQDQPCASDETQQKREMIVPDDPPVVGVVPAPTPTPTATQSVSPQEVRVAAVRPQPLYECQRPDGSVYESDTGIPLRHWVPLALRLPNRPDMARRIGQPRIIAPQPADANAAGANPALLASGTWIEETCYALPAAEACARRRDRLSQLGKDWYLAFPSERDQIERRQQSLREQLRAECGDQ